MRICFDLDGVIAEFKKKGESYADVKPVSGSIEKLKALKDNGHFIIINTARHMKTCEGNTGAVVAKIGKITLDWLEKHQVPYDEIYFGKPWAQIYVDDNAFRFTSWNEIGNNGEGLPANVEDTLKR